MRRLAAIAMIAETVCGVRNAQAQLPAAFHKACPDAKTTERWCPPQALNEGWKLKYKSESPKNLADKYWRYEVWVHNEAAAVCMFLGGYAGTKINYCQELREVSE